MRSWTTIEQSERLVSLGFGADTASCHWHHVAMCDEPLVLAGSMQRDGDGDVPAWTLADLMAMLPHVIGLYALRIIKSASGWLVEYRYMHGAPLVLHDETGCDLVDVCAAMVAWLKEHKHQLEI